MIPAKTVFNLIVYIILIAFLLGMSTPKRPKIERHNQKGDTLAVNKPCKLRLDDIYAWVDRMPSTQPKEPMIRLKLTFTAFGPGYITTPIVFIQSDSKNLSIIHSELDGVTERFITRNDTLKIEQKIELLSDYKKELTLKWIEPNSKDTLTVPKVNVESVY